jgi:hypothetical protein
VEIGEERDEHRRPRGEHPILPQRGSDGKAAIGRALPAISTGVAALEDTALHPMGVVEFVPTAIVTLAQVPGLMGRVEPDQLLRIVLDGFSITYTVDLQRNAAKVLSAAPLDVDIAMRRGLDAMSYVD